MTPGVCGVYSHPQLQPILLQDKIRKEENKGGGDCSLLLREYKAPLLKVNAGR